MTASLHGRCVPLLPVTLIGNLTANLGLNATGIGASSGASSLAALTQRQLSAGSARLDQAVGEMQRGRWLIVIAGAYINLELKP